LGEFDITWDRSRDTLYQWWHDDGIVAAVFVDFTGKWHLTMEFHGDPGEPPELSRFQALFRERTGEADARLGEAVWMDRLTINQRMPSRFQVGRAFLAGDAAHVHSGAGGQGMNTGMQDALNLGWKLSLAAAGDASPTLLESYEAERLPNARDLLRASRLYHRIQVPHGAIARWIGGAVLKAIQWLPWVGDLALARLGMLDVNYERGPLSQQATNRPRRHVRAGWRLPDAPCRLGARATRLFEIIRGEEAQLMLFAGPAPDEVVYGRLREIAAALSGSAAPLRVLYVFASEAHMASAGVAPTDAIVDGGGHVQHLLDLRGPEVIYVRPDGYIGLRTDDLRIEPIAEYLGRIYAPRRLASDATPRQPAAVQAHLRPAEPRP
jgi:hypothetical protein